MNLWPWTSSHKRIPPGQTWYSVQYEAIFPLSFPSDPVILSGGVNLDAVFHFVLFLLSLFNLNMSCCEIKYFFHYRISFYRIIMACFFFFFSFLSPIGIKNSSNFLLTTYMTTIKLFRNLLVYSNFLYVWETSWLWSAHMPTNPLIWLYMKLPAALCAIFPWCSFTFLVGLWDCFAVIWTHWRILLMSLQAMDLFS